jgi:DNA-binding transcriptional MerR regulator
MTSRTSRTEGLMTIGAFSRASLLSIKALRAYHEAGILVPAQVDPRNGYRAYRSSQLTDAAVVQRLRSLDLPLSQVKEVLTARDPSVTQRVLADHGSAMQARLDEMARIVDELQSTADHPEAHTPVHVRVEPAAPTLCVRGQVSEASFAIFLGDAFGALEKVAAELGVAPAGPPGGLYPPEIVDDDTEDVEAYLPLAAPVSGPLPSGTPVEPGSLPEARVAVATHRGPYDTIADTYRLVGAWVAENATSAERPVRESYVVSYGQTDDTARFRTEILWPILG